jgi:hypothetical protein
LSQTYRLPHILGHILTRVLQKCEQAGEVMSVRKLEPAMDQHRFKRLLCHLLGIEAEVFEITSGIRVLALARLLRARCSHSRGSSGRSCSGGI